MHIFETAAVPATIVGLSAIVMGIGLLLARRQSARVSGAVAASVTVLLLLGSGVAWFGFASATWAVAFALVAAIWSVGWDLRSQYLCYAAMRRLGNPSFQALLLVLGGLALTFGTSSTSKSTTFDKPSGARAVETFLASEARTDRGTRLPLFEPVGRDRRSPPTETDSQAMLGHAAAFHVLRTADPDPNCNCHGWIFTGGAFWVRSEDVPLILEENGYTAVTDPLPNDLIVYYNQEGAVVHQGLVRAAAPDGLILIESKWGVQGCYVHLPQSQAYTSHWRYFRSTRQGHLLRGDYPRYSPDDSKGDPAHLHGT